MITDVLEIKIKMKTLAIAKYEAKMSAGDGVSG